MKVSIVIPCYNVSPYLDRAIASALGQSYPDLEIVCVNDGSSDDTLAKLLGYQQIHPQLITVIDQKNSGANKARNRGLEASNGVYIQFLDADDELYKDKISSQAALAKHNDYPNLVVGGYERRNVNGKTMERRLYNHSGTTSHWIRLMKSDLGITSSNLFKREAVMQVGGWDETAKSSQEYHLMFKLLTKNPTVVYDKNLLTVIHSRNEGSISQTDPGANWKRYVALRAEILNYIQSNGKCKDLSPAYQILFDSIRCLYPYDKKEALKYYRHCIPSDFKPGPTETTTKSYLRMYKLFGFAITEALKVRLFSNQTYNELRHTSQNTETL